MNQLTWASLLKNLVELLQIPVGLFFSPLKLYKSLGYVESMILGWIHPRNSRFFLNLWENQKVLDTVLERMDLTVFLQSMCSMTLGWSDDFLKPQFSSSESDYIFVVVVVVLYKVQ